MYFEKRILAIIPARGGSKRLPRKNIKNLAGKHLIGWTIESALNSKYLDETMVSTDSIEIAEISKKYGANIPFIRPDYLSSDVSSSFDVAEHVINFYKVSLNKNFDYIILLQPTSPLRNSLDIDLSIELLFEKNADAIISVCECEHSPLWCNVLPDNMCMDGFESPSIKNIRSQDLPIYYRLNGAIFLTRTERLLEEKTFQLSSNSYAYIMHQHKSIDIDNDLDFKLAELIINKNL